MRKRLPSLGALAVAIATLAAFAPCLRHGFVDFDDDLYLQLAARAFEGPDRLRFFFGFHDGNYVPLSWLLLGLDYALGGANALAYHLTSVLLHAANAVLFYFIAHDLYTRRAGAQRHSSLRSGPIGSAVCAALIFSLHPLRVQSVAWVSDQRDVLAGFFTLATFWLWLRGWKRLALAPFAAALLSKPTALPVPAALVLLDFFLEGRADWRRAAPFLALSAAAAALAFSAQSSAEAVVGWAAAGAPPRAARAAVGLFFYLGKFLWPARLSLYEWRWTEVGAATLLGAAATAALALVAARAPRRRAPIAAALVFQWVMLSPILAVALGHELAADRYSYLSGLGLALLAGGAFAAAARGRPRAAAVAAALVLALMAGATRLQEKNWRDGVSFWRGVVRADPGSLGRVGLFAALNKAGRAGEAVLCLQEHVRVHPEDERARALLAGVIRDNGLTRADLDDFGARLARERAYGRETCP